MTTWNAGLPALFVSALLALAPWPAAAGKIFGVQADAMLAPDDAANYGTGQAIVVGGGRSMLIRFGDFPTPPGVDPKNDSSSVSDVRASLHFYVKQWNGVEGGISFANVTGDWDEASVTGLTPLERGPSRRSLPVDGAGQWYALDLSNEVQNWLRHPTDPNRAPRSFELGTGSGLQASIASRESGRLAPYLEVRLDHRSAFYTKEVKFEADGSPSFNSECDSMRHDAIAAQAYTSNGRVSVEYPFNYMVRTRWTSSYHRTGDGMIVPDSPGGEITVIMTCWWREMEEWVH